ncbi:hypothetical protein WI89_08075 [Burkholderia ubonensis]|nr:hypothetical protein WI89_08075 [Burkholderia ubonensis]
MNAMKGDIVLEREQTKRTILKNVTLANLHMASTRSKAVQTFTQPVTSQAIQHDIDTMAVGHGTDRFTKLCRAMRIEDLVQPQYIAQIGALFLGASGSDDIRAERTRDLYGGLSNAACSGMDQHRFTSLKLSDMVQSVPGGRIGSEKARAVNIVYVVRLENCVPRLHDCHRAE